MRVLLSVGVLWSVGVWSLCVVTCDQQPVLTPGNHGDLHVQVPGIAGAVSVSVSVSGDLLDLNHGLHTSSVLVTTPSVDGNWQARLRDVSGKDGVIHYVIEYQFPDGVHTVRGSQSLANTETAVGQSLSSKRYLTRRATTVVYDDFSSGHLDPHTWYNTINAGSWAGSNQSQMYTPEPVNCYVRNGVLHIRPTFTVDHFGANYLSHGNLNAKEQWGSCDHGICETDGWNSIRPIMSAMIRSHKHIRYGKVEIVAKLAKGDWFWNALWMMPMPPTAYGAGYGEIDLLEAAGNRHFTSAHGDHGSRGVDYAHSSFHFGIGREQDVHVTDGYVLPQGTFGDAFHTYWLDWTEDLMRVGVDDHTTVHLATPSQGFYAYGHQHGHNVWAQGGKNAPFDQPFYLIMNVAVAGNMFGGGYWINHPYARPWDPHADNHMMQFWNARHLWEPTWQGESASLQIKSVKMQQY